MVFLAEVADGGDSRKGDVGDIRNGPGHGQRREAAVLVELIPQVMTGNDVDGLAAQAGPQDEEAQFRPQDFADPGNNKARHEAEDGSVDGQKGNRRQAGHVGDSDHEDTDEGSIDAKRRNIIDEAVDITGQAQVEQFLIEVGDDPLDAPKSQEQAQADGSLHHFIP